MVCGRLSLSGFLVQFWLGLCCSDFFLRCVFVDLVLLICGFGYMAVGCVLWCCACGFADLAVWDFWVLLFVGLV